MMAPVYWFNSHFGSVLPCAFRRSAKLPARVRRHRVQTRQLRDRTPAQPPRARNPPGAPTRQSLKQLYCDAGIGKAGVDRVARQGAEVFVRPSERLAAQRVLALQAGAQQHRGVGVEVDDDAGVAQARRTAAQERLGKAWLSVTGRWPALTAR